MYVNVHVGHSRHMSLNKPTIPTMTTMSLKKVHATVRRRGNLMATWPWRVH
jgi:hypothetical protein